MVLFVVGTFSVIYVYVYTLFEFEKNGLPKFPLLFCQTPSGVADRNPISDEFKQQLLKHLPVMRTYKLHEAAVYLEGWVLGTLELEPLLNVKACFGFDWAVFCC